MDRKVAVLAVGVLVIGLAGCGGSGGGGHPGAVGPGGPGGTVTQAIGPIVVQTAASSDYKSVSLGQGDEGPYAFTGIYGSKITRLEYRPSPGRLTGRIPGNDRNGIVVSEEDGSNETVIISEEPGYPYPAMPRYSPDGNLIALIEGNRFFICNRDGSDLRVALPRENVTYNGFDWIPDTDMLVAVFARSTGQYDLGIFNWANGTAAVTWLTDNSQVEYEPDVSHDGRMLTWAEVDPQTNTTDIWAMALWGDRTQDARQITGTSDNDRWPRWSPDGQYIAFYSTSRSYSHIYVYDVYREILRQLTDGAVWDRYPAWTSDSRYILFCRDEDLYMISVDGSPGDETLLVEKWGTHLDSWAAAPGRYRVLIGPSGTDWDGNDPPFGTSRLGAIVVYSEEKLINALTFSVSSGETISLRDRTPALSNTVVCEARAGHVHRVLMDNGAGVPKTVWDLRDENNESPGAVLITFNAASGRVASVIPIWEEATSSAVGSGVKVEAEGGRIVISGAPMRVYDGSGKLVSGPERVFHVVLDEQTGAPL